jgi:hypothetical protein
MNEVAQRLGLRPLFVNTQWEVILRQMEDSLYDCIVGGITITPARQQTLAWSTPYMTTTLSLVINSDRTPQIRGLADLKEASVGVQAATTDYDVAVAMHKRREINSVKVYPFDHIGDAMTDLAAGRITAVMKVYPVAAWLARETPGLRVVAQVPDDPQLLGIGFNKSNPALVAAVNGRPGGHESGRRLRAPRAQMGRAVTRVVEGHELKNCSSRTTISTFPAGITLSSLGVSRSNRAFNRTPVPAFHLATVGGGAPVNLVSLGVEIPW